MRSSVAFTAGLWGLSLGALLRRNELVRRQDEIDLSEIESISLDLPKSLDISVNSDERGTRLRTGENFENNIQDIIDSVDIRLEDDNNEARDCTERLVMARRGSTCETLAQQFQVANRDIGILNGLDVEQCRQGFDRLQQICVPTKSCNSLLLARPNETCEELASRHRLTIDELLEANSISLNRNNCRLIPGISYCCTRRR